ncbi:MAG: hypothetical protein MUF33_10340 [Candidatus Nanopelagicales bacterium]|jgi:hypothetical protein|nr:hypothetical protein [Candidatus Nanopelagicales bacterium]
MDPVAVVNALNLTTPTGLLWARLAGCPVRSRGGYLEASGYRWRFPVAGAFTIGCVVISRSPLTDVVWEHEVSHMRQYAVLGPLFWPAYGVAAAWSWVRTGDWWSRNVFERRAGLRAGGYVERPLRRSGRPRRGGTGAGAAVA